MPVWASQIMDRSQMQKSTYNEKMGLVSSMPASQSNKSITFLGFTVTTKTRGKKMTSENLITFRACILLGHNLYNDSVPMPKIQITERKHLLFGHLRVNS
jgi:hypothetical protein